jgi:hypothetical protein
LLNTQLSGSTTAVAGSSASGVPRKPAQSSTRTLELLGPKPFIDDAVDELLLGVVVLGEMSRNPTPANTIITTTKTTATTRETATLFLIECILSSTYFL